MNDIQAPMPSPNAPLSDAGRQRRGHMLTELQRSMHQWHGRRRRNRRLAVTAIPMLMVALGLIWWRVNSLPATIDPSTKIIDNNTNRVETPTSFMVVQQIVTDPNALDRFRIDNRSSIEIIDDSSLLSLLAEMDRPTGLIAAGGEIRLTRNVVDTPEFKPPPPGS